MLSNAKIQAKFTAFTITNMLFTITFEMTERRRRRRRPKVVPRAAVDFVRQLKISFPFLFGVIVTCC